MEPYKMNEKLNHIDIAKANAYLKDKGPLEIIDWALNVGQRPILTTNFGPYSATLLHAVSSLKDDIKVIWCDTGYNTPHTYRYAKEMINSLSLNIKIYTPKTTAGYRDVQMGIPEVDSEAHKIFTEEVKLEPFRRALADHQPDIWLTNLRKSQNEYRKNLDILHYGKDGILKVCPFFYSSDFELELYLKAHDLPNENNYFDPTKVFEKRECGLHL